MTASNDLFCPQLKDIQFTVIEEERSQKIFTYKNLELDNFDLFFLFLFKYMLQL